MDDEPLARARLRALLAKHADMQLVGECAEGGEAIAAIGRTHPEVVFLDIQMTETTGLDVATSLAAEPRPAVVFVTAHERYALEAFEVRALDYLLKPFEESRFTATLDRVRTYTSAIRAQRSHEHLVGILRELSNTPLAELERLRAPAMPLRFADIDAGYGDPGRPPSRAADRAPAQGIRAAGGVDAAGRGSRVAPRAVGGSLGLSGERDQSDRGHSHGGVAPEDGARPR